AYAFGRDALRQLRREHARMPLSAEARLKLAAKSYVEVVANCALIDYCLTRLLPERLYRGGLSDIAESLYFSAMTITTVGYGDIVPVHVVSRLMAVYEVFIGVLLLVLTVGAYIAD